MNRINEEFSDQVDMFYLDVDVADTYNVMDKYSIRSRSTYVLLDAAGNELVRWIGPLPYGGISHEIEVALGDA